MFNFNADLDNIADDYNKALEYLREIYKTKLLVSTHAYVAKKYPTFTGSIYFEVNRDFLSVVVNSHVPQHRTVESIQQNLHKNLCTLSPDLLQCLDDVTISI